MVPCRLWFCGHGSSLDRVVKQRTASTIGFGMTSTLETVWKGVN